LRPHAHRRPSRVARAAHVGDADADSYRAVGTALGDFDLIEIARFTVVD